MSVISSYEAPSVTKRSGTSDLSIYFKFDYIRLMHGKFVIDIFSINGLDIQMV